MKKAKTWTFEDRSNWPDFDLGWGKEPDKAEWRDPDTGLPCIARRGSSGAWCGYVGVSPGHPFHKVGYGDCPQNCAKYQKSHYCDHSPDAVLCAHGGLTFAAACSPDHEYGVCHVPQEGESDDVWWLGFDCAHAGDFTPGYWKILHDTMAKMGDANVSLLRQDMEGNVYRTLDYVKLECAHLAKQLAELQ